MDENIQQNVKLSQQGVELFDSTFGCNMLIMEFKDRLREAMKKAGIEQKALKGKMGVSITTIQYWLTGRNKPSRDKIKRLAEEIKCSPEWLEFGASVELSGLSQKDSNVVSLVIPTEIKTVPLISWVQAGNWCAIPDNYPPGHAEEMIPCPSKCGPHSFALRVKGDSMDPDYPDGSIVIVDPDKEPRHNSDVVVRLNGEMEATFKRLKIDGPRWFLHPVNDRYPVLPLEGKDFTICGVVVWVGREVG
ncbi:LexA family protein [Leptospirillum ferrooxidans]|uniref:Putative phage lambda repressor protein. Serine peptidase. MEROPS family S24 n=1 Tax=Leptospirillum ferrooxidans (strain C2-3) TaxID=1162668 RepID=I0ILV4_LEPFC|nr:S24 family peptidase [Leptospirillum ferrooxidans]BAM06253.1 putative phage lambda repressor protein. Serine peptidase. MEROPS family S24 [Leptospirillum ferrooxidans C2-3]